MKHKLRAILQSSSHVDLTNRATLVENLIHVYFVIVASEPLMELAVAKSSGPLQDYYTAHLEEERGHAAWLAKDLLSAGVDVATLNPPLWCAEVAGSQYYCLSHQPPEVFLGYLAVLECFPMEMEVLEKIEASVGRELTHTLRYHAINDVNHGSDVWDAIDKWGTPATARNAIHVAYKVAQLSTYLETLNG